MLHSGYWIQLGSIIILAGKYRYRSPSPSSPSHGCHGTSSSRLALCSISCSFSNSLVSGASGLPPDLWTSAISHWISHWRDFSEATSLWENTWKHFGNTEIYLEATSVIWKHLETPYVLLGIQKERCRFDRPWPQKTKETSETSDTSECITGITRTRLQSHSSASNGIGLGPNRWGSPNTLAERVNPLHHSSALWIVGVCLNGGQQLHALVNHRCPINIAIGCRLCSGKHTKTMERSTICSWVNPLFLWPCSIAFCMFTRQGTYIYPLVMTNSLPWKDPPFLRTVNHLFHSISMGHFPWLCDK